MDLELVLDARATIGESPTWVSAQDAVYWIDVKEPALHRLQLGTRQDVAWPLPCDVGAFALVAGRDEALVALREGLFRLDLATGGLVRVAAPPFDPGRHRFNEGACDSTGRFWVGTMFDPQPGVTCDPQPSGLSSFTLGGGLRPEPDVAELHNGMAWSADETVFFLSHSKEGTVFAFDFDPVRGILGPRRPFVTVPPALGVPDGSAVDVEGGYWCALHGSGRVARFHADGRFDRDVVLPVSQPTMCAFAGDALDLMVVTTAADGLMPEQLAQQPHAGGIFAFRPGVRGVARHCHVG